MPKIEHVLLDYSRHFLVVDGTRGPVEEYGNNPATHPAGYLRFREDGYNIPAALRGKVLRFEEVAVTEVKIDAPKEAELHWLAFNDAKRAASAAEVARYPEAKP
jgi:hypothetical protein